MAKAHTLRHIPHNPDDLVKLVSDVENYPQFINLISAMRVAKRTQITDTHEQFEADATVVYKFIRENFGSIVDVHSDTRQISVRKAGEGGAVKNLSNNWKFHELSDGSTLVDFSVEVKLKAFPLEILLRDKFEKLGMQIMNVFEAKAAKLFPKVGQENLDLKAECARLGLKAEDIQVKLQA